MNLSKLDKKNNYFLFGDHSKYKNLNLKFLNQNLFLGGYVSYNKIPKLLKKMDIFLMPYSNTVTSGGGEYAIRTLYVHRSTSIRIRSKRFIHLIAAIQEERVTRIK